MSLNIYPESNGVRDLLTKVNYISRKPVYDYYVEKLSNIEGSILDFGCGDMPYRQIFKRAKEYIGLDVGTAKEYGFSEKGVVFYNGLDIPFSDERFDCVISAQVFEHVQDIDYSIREISRVLKTEGILCFSVPMAYPVHMAPYDFRRFTNYGLEDLLRKNGFGDIEIKGANREIDSIRFLKIRMRPKALCQPYTLFANICFLYGLKGADRITIKIENLIRKVLRRSPKKEDLLKLPLNYLVYCKKTGGV